MKKINLPNKLTIMRLLLVPVFTFFMLFNWKLSPFLALLVFAAASVTDWLDGKIARSKGLITDFGKFLDPLADKVLVLSALTVFVEIPEISIVEAVP